MAKNKASGNARTNGGKQNADTRGSVTENIARTETGRAAIRAERKANKARRLAEGEVKATVKAEEESTLAKLNALKQSILKNLRLDLVAGRTVQTVSIKGWNFTSYTHRVVRSGEIVKEFPVIQSETGVFIKVSDVFNDSFVPLKPELAKAQQFIYDAIRAGCKDEIGEIRKMKRLAKEKATKPHIRKGDHPKSQTARSPYNLPNQVRKPKQTHPQVNSIH